MPSSSGPSVAPSSPPWPMLTRAELRLASIRRSRASSCSVVRRSSRRASKQTPALRRSWQRRRGVEVCHRDEYAGSLRISTTEANGVAERFLRTFIEEVYLPRIAGDASDSAVTVDDVLSSPPRHDLSADRRFWTMLARFSIYRFREPLVDDETRSYVPQALECFAIIKVTYSCLTRRPVDPAVVQEANALIRRGNVSAQRARPVATHDNLVHFVRQGAFGSHLLLRCPREQIQMAAFHQLNRLLRRAAQRRCARPIAERRAALARRRLFPHALDSDEEDDSNDAAAQAARSGKWPRRRTAKPAQAKSSASARQALAERRRAPGSTATSRSAMSRAARPTREHGAPNSCTTAAAPPALSPCCCLPRWPMTMASFKAASAFAHALEEADPSFFDNRNFLRVHIKREARDQFVFRAFELVDVGSSDDGAAASSTAAAPSTLASTLASTAGPSTSTSAAAAPAAAVAIRHHCAVAAAAQPAMDRLGLGTLHAQHGRRHHGPSGQCMRASGIPV